MKHVRTVFESVKWTELRPAQKFVTEQPGDKNPAKFVACAATPDEKTFVFYYPPGTLPKALPTVDSDAALGANVRPNWWNPRTGERKSFFVLKPDPDQDWVLTIQK
jgi:hypothetical protein